MTDDNVSARAILLTPEETVLLMNVAGRIAHLWITPGGRIRGGEEPLAALERELREETGLQESPEPVEVWIRHGRFRKDGRDIWEREHFYLIRSPRFVPADRGMEPEERSRHLGFRWWGIPEILQSSERFVPGRMGALLRELARAGPPPRPIEIR